ncbi:MAG: hypothetical protein Q7S20_07500 [Gemmatimonadaceae bacterium]|nr:hypothetical protein [Gemmatimonadaceae bacterium]
MRPEVARLRLVVPRFAEDLRADEARFDALFLVLFLVLFRADDFFAPLFLALFFALEPREDDLRADGFRPPELPPLLFLPFEPPRDDFLAAAML